MTRAIALLLLLANTGVHATEVFATVAEGKLGARIDAIAFPETLPKELTSGLTNRLYARVTLLDAQQTLDQRAVEIAIRYDLWDQVFTVVSTMNAATVESRSVTSLAEITALLGALPLPKLFDAAALPAARDLTLRVEVLLNPIDREKMSMIRKWVAQNTTPELGADRSFSTSNAIFNRIFEQYSQGSDIAAMWRVDVTSKPFRLDSLMHERR